VAAVARQDWPFSWFVAEARWIPTTTGPIEQFNRMQARTSINAISPT
jgi:hypothetical protein